MTTKITVHCDRCGAFISDKNPDASPLFLATRLAVGGIVWKDLCTSCADSLEEWFSDPLAPPASSRRSSILPPPSLTQTNFLACP